MNNGRGDDWVMVRVGDGRMKYLEHMLVTGSGIGLARNMILNAIAG